MSGRRSLVAAVLMAELALPVAAQTPTASSASSASAQPSPPPEGSTAAGHLPPDAAQQQRQQDNAAAAAAAGAGAVIVGTQLDGKEDPFAFPAPTVRARQAFGYASPSTLLILLRSPPSSVASRPRRGAGSAGRRSW